MLSPCSGQWEGTREIDKGAFYIHYEKHLINGRQLEAMMIAGANARGDEGEAAAKRKRVAPKHVIAFCFRNIKTHDTPLMIPREGKLSTWIAVPSPPDKEDVEAALLETNVRTWWPGHTAPSLFKQPTQD